jgi:predicted alpha/beta-hydrolase family hydrolase
LNTAAKKLNTLQNKTGVAEVKSVYAFAVLMMIGATMRLLSVPAYAGEASIVTALGQDVPTDSHLPEDYRFPAEYRDNAVQFRTSDDVLLCGYVLGEGSCGITLGHASGWMVKSWLPFAERLADAGYMVIMWEFRNIEPSGFAPESQSRRWELDVLAAAQVLRERGAAQILCMGASDGGTATVIAAPDIPELTGLGILSSPKNSIGDAVEAIGRMKDVPAFFAVSTKDSFGNFYPHVEALYQACPSTHKQFMVIEGSGHGTDMIMPEVPGVGYASFPNTDAQIEERQKLADELFRFVNEAFNAAAADTLANTDA